MLLKNKLVHVNLQETNDGITPLHLAVLNDDFDIVKALIERGAKTKITDLHGNKPIAFAISNEIKQLLEPENFKS